MATETIVDIAREMIGITSRVNHSTETKVLVLGYADRILKAHRRELDGLKETLNKTMEVFNGKNK